MTELNILEILNTLELPAGMLILWIFIYRMRKDHLLEREQWLSWMKSSHEHIIELMTEIKTILKTK